jgi:branched-chain amino acid transport system substrate-binding protein
MVAAFAILGAVLTAGCVSSVKTETTQSRTVSVGALLPLTGDASSIGANVNSTIHAAEADVNSYLAARTAGIRVQLVVKDTGTTPEGALAGLEALHAAGVTAVVGSYSSAEPKAIAPYACSSVMAARPHFSG